MPKNFWLYVQKKIFQSLKLCARREIIIGEMQLNEEVNARMTHVLEIMKDAAFSPIETPCKIHGWTDWR